MESIVFLLPTIETAAVAKHSVSAYSANLDLLSPIKRKVLKLRPVLLGLKRNQVSIIMKFLVKESVFVSFKFSDSIRLSACISVLKR